MEALVAANQHEDAINICQICENKNLIVGIDVTYIYEANAFAMLAKGDFEKAVQNFIHAKTDFLVVAANFPDFIPHNLQNALNINPSQVQECHPIDYRRFVQWLNLVLRRLGC